MNKVSRKALAGVAAASIMLLALSGCTAAKPDACGVSDEGSWHDKSFNQSVKDGLDKAAKDLGVNIKTAESKSSTDFAPNLQQMVDAKCGIIIAVGFNLIDAVNKAAEENPTLNFVAVDGYVNKPTTTNLKPVNYATAQSSYLAGYLAAGYSTTKVVGVYGGMQISSVTDYMSGYYYGAMSWGAENGKTVKVVGWNPKTNKGDFMGDFVPNSATSKSIAAAQIKQGADVIMPVAGDQFGAVSSAITDAGTNGVMIGVDKNIAVTSPEYAKWTITSVEKRMTQAVYDIVKGVHDGTPFSGTPYVGTLANDGTGLSSFGAFDSKIDSALKTRLTEIQASIIAGTTDPLKVNKK